MSEPIPGRRVYLDTQGRLSVAEGDYGKMADGFWLCRPPGRHAGIINHHQVTEHEDGTITVSPSLVIDDGDSAQPPWHGFLEHGMWRTV